MESLVSLGGKEGCTNIQISAEPNWGPCGQKAEILELRQPFPMDEAKGLNKVPKSESVLQNKLHQK